MKDFMMIEKDNSIDLSIQLVNDISVYAKRVTTVTLHTAGVITTCIDEMPYAQLRKEISHNQLASEYIGHIAALVERFGQKLDDALAAENIMIKQKEDLTRFKFLRRALVNWQPLALIVNSWINGVYQWFLFRIDQVSKSYLNQLIESIQFTEVGNEQQ